MRRGWSGYRLRCVHPSLFGPYVGRIQPERVDTDSHVPGTSRVPVEE